MPQFRLGSPADRIALPVPRAPLLPADPELDFGPDVLAGTHDFLLRACGPGAALAVTAPAGSGRSALVRTVAQQADRLGMTTVRAGGGAERSDSPFAALDDLAAQLGTRGAARPGDAAEIRDLIRRWRCGTVPSATVADGVERLLRGVAGRAPLLLALDDVHLVDVQTVGLVRQIVDLLDTDGSGDRALPRVGVLMAGGPDGVPAALTGVRRLGIPPLGDRTARNVLRTRFPDLAPAVAARVVLEAGGNPMALRELAAGLTPAQRSGRVHLPDVLPLPGHLLPLFGSAIDSLPETARELLLVVALQGAAPLERVLAFDGGWTDEDARCAVQAGLLRPRPCSGSPFAHPLVRPTVLALSTSLERRLAHRHLLRLERDPLRRSWHLGRATLVADRVVAQQLVAASRTHQAAGDHAAAVDALVEAAHLEPHPARTASLLAQAAHLDATVLGAVDDSHELLDRVARIAAPGPQSLALAIAKAHRQLVVHGDVDTGQRMLSAALGHHRPGNRGDPLPGEALDLLLDLCVAGDRPRLWRALEDATAVASSRSADVRERLSPPAVTDPRAAVRLARAAQGVDQLGAHRPHLLAVVRAGHQGSATAEALTLLAEDCFASGRWSTAAEYCRSALDLADRLGHRLERARVQCVQALLAAGRGDDAAARSLCDQVEQWAAPRGLEGLTSACLAARCLAAIARTDFDEGFAHAAALLSAGGPPRLLRSAPWVALDLLEAAAHTGRRDEAHRWLRASLAAGDDVGRLSPRRTAVVHLCAALTADRRGADAAFDAAVTVPGGGAWPFDRARIQLAHGEHLRRARRLREARSQLSTALDGFRALGAGPWVERARSELDATGPAHAGGVPGRSLTPQEREVALLAASGLSNRAVAEALLMSPRTVASHLRAVFPKLGITSRAALRDALAGASGDGLLHLTSA